MKANVANINFLMLAAFVLLCSFVSVSAQRGATLRGQVTDQFGAVIVVAPVTLIDANGREQLTQTDDRGAYHFNNLAAGIYTLRVAQLGFATYDQTGLNIGSGITTHDVKLSVTIETQRVTVDDTRALSADPNSNKSARVLSGKELNALSDDPDELAAELNALAGPAAGPSGTQVFVDGFLAGPVPDKQTISQIVINQNPFSAEYDRIGFGNIQVFTKPGTGKLHGGAGFTFSDAVFNSRNPYAPNRPPYQRRAIEGNLSGPLSKKASFFFGFSRRDIDDTAVVNATTLDASLNPIIISQAMVTPKKFMSIGPRLDLGLNKNNTLTVRYNLNTTDLSKQGIGGFNLASRAYDYSDRWHSTQVIDMAILNPRTVNEFGFQYLWYNIKQTSRDPSAGLIVLDAFSSGGSQIGSYSFKRREGLLRDYVTLTTGRHTLKFGVFLNWAHISDIAPTNFGGTFIFTSLDLYRRTLQHTAAPTQLIIAGGNPFAEARVSDFAPFIQDDWKIRPDFTLSMGMRYQYQNSIHSRVLFAPRLSFAWTPWFTTKGQPKTVIRGGAGIFYDWIRTLVTVQSNRFDGNTEKQYIVTDPALLNLFPAIPSSSALASLSQPQTIWRQPADLTQPYYLQSSISIERTLPRHTTLSISYLDTHGQHQLRSRNLNAPAPGTGLRPFGNAFNVYDYETSGSYRQHLLVVNTLIKPNTRINLNANYTFGRASGDTDGAGTFPADSYNMRTEFSRSSFDVRHRLTLTGSLDTRWGISFFPLVIASTGAPFNIITGLDNNLDSLFTDRPAFATDMTRPSVRQTAFGNFDLLPLPGAKPIPRNFGQGPGYFSANLRMAKTFGFGSASKAPTKAQGSGGGAKNGAPAKVQAVARPEDNPYKLTISVFVANLFNRTNQGPPISNLTSPSFGTSNSLSGISQLTFGASAAQSNRSMTLRAQFNF